MHALSLHGHEGHRQSGVAGVVYRWHGWRPGIGQRGWHAGGATGEARRCALLAMPLRNSSVHGVASRMERGEEG
jgi:hypothetical protein